MTVHRAPVPVRISQPFVPARRRAWCEPYGIVGERPHNAPMRLLYVEDNRLNALLFEEMLRLTDGYELQIAEDGQQALQLVAQWRPDVLVLDAHLPDMDGYSLLAQLRARQPELAAAPVFICSADSGPEAEQRAADAGATGYWHKPIDLPRILADLAAVHAGLRPTA